MIPSRLAAIAVGLAVIAPSVVAAQSMSFSVYTAPSAANGSVTVESTVLDYSTGCSHWNYATTAKIYSPSNRSATSTSNGLSAYTSLSFDSEFGTYTTATTGTYNCSCIFGSAAGFGGGQQIQVPRPTNIELTGSGSLGGTPNGCSGPPRYFKYRDYQVKDQNNAAISRSMGITETFSNASPNCFGVALVEGGGATNGQGQFRDYLWLCDAPGCNGGGSCTLTRTQTFSADGQSLSPSFAQTYTCSNVTVQE